MRVEVCPRTLEITCSEMPADAIPCGYGWMEVVGPLEEAMRWVREKAKDIAFRAVQNSPELAVRVAAVPRSLPPPSAAISVESFQRGEFNTGRAR